MAHNVLVAGYYGFGNAGDESILDGLIHNVLPTGSRIVVLSADPEATSAFHHVAAVSWLNIPDVVTNVRDCDLVVIGGGGLFHDYLGLNLGRVLAWDSLRFESIVSVGLLAKLYGKTLLIAGAGVGPLRTELARELTRQVFSASLAAMVRDAESATELREMGVAPEKVSVGADLAFLTRDLLRDSEITTEAARAPVARTTGHVSVVIRNWSFGKSQWYWIREVADALRAAFYDSHTTLQAIPMQVSQRDSIDDTRASEELAKVLGPDVQLTIPSEPLTFSETIRRIEESRLVLSMRYHGIVYAARAGVPVVALSPDKKIAHLMADLKLSEYCLPLETLSGEALADKLARAAADPNNPREILLERAKGLALRCAHARDNLREVLAESGTSHARSQDRLGEAGAEGAVTNDRRVAVADEPLDATSTSQAARTAVLREIESNRRLRGGSLSGTDRPESPKPSRVRMDRGIKADSDALAAILVQGIANRGVVVFAPTVDWGFMLQRPQQMARALAREGFLCLYCTGNLQTDNVRGFRMVAERVYVSDVDPAVLEAIPRPVLILGSPWHAPWVEYFDHAVAVYDICDDITVSGGTQADHLELLRRADIVVTSSKVLFNKALSQRGDVVLIPNGVDMDAIRMARRRLSSRPAALHASSTRGRRAIVGYMGAMAGWVDYGLIEKAARSYPDYDFVLVGADYDGSIGRSNLARLENVSWLGALGHIDALAEVLQFDVATIPFTQNEITRAASPIKLFEYMACGKPSVTTALPECEGYEGVFVAGAADDFLPLIREALDVRNDPALRKALIDNAKENTWMSRARALASRLELLAEDHLVERYGLVGARGESFPALSAFTESLTEIAVARERLRSTRSDLRRLEVSSKAVEQDLAGARGEIAEFEATIAQNQEALARIQEELAHMRVLRDADRARTAEVVDQARQVPELKSKVETLRCQRDDILRERNHLEVELGDLRTTLGVRLLNVYWRSLKRLFPEGGRARQAFMLVRGLLRHGWRSPWGMPGEMGADVPVSAGTAPEGALQDGAPPGSSFTASLPDPRGDLVRFEEQVSETKVERVVAIFSTTRLNEDEGQRATQLALELAGRKVPVVFVYWRWAAEALAPQDRLGDGIVQLPLEAVVRHPESLCGSFTGLERVALFEFPYPELVRTLASANALGWITGYDVVDDWQGFKRVGQAGWYDRSFEHNLALTADFVTAVNARLASHVQSMGRDTVSILPNGVRPGIERIDRVRPLERGEITVGYFGYLSGAWFDWELVAGLARNRPSWRIYLIGYGGGPGRVSLPANVVLLGKQPQTALASYAANWEVAIVPFKPGSLSENADPIKTYEYLAMGLPVVVTGVYPPQGGESLVGRAGGVDEFAARIESSIGERDLGAEARRLFAADSTWSHRVDTLLGLLEQGADRVSEKRWLARPLP